MGDEGGEGGEGGDVVEAVLSAASKRGTADVGAVLVGRQVNGVVLGLFVSS